MTFTMPPAPTILMGGLAVVYGLGVVLLFLGISLMLLALLDRHTFSKYKLDESYRPMVSLIIPAHNEEEVIERTIQGFAATTYPMDKKEVIIINDGSTDRTEEIVRKYAYTVIADGDVPTVEVQPNGYRHVTLINRKEGGHGKSFALNSGKKYARGEGIMVIDADIQLSPDVFEKAVRHLADPQVDAVAGYVEVSWKKRNFLNQMIDFEYVVGQKILRRGYNVLGVHYIIPGGCGLFRRSTLDRVGDYHADTLAEDTDLTWRLMTEAHGKIHFDPAIKVVADEPANLLSLWNQRVRWARGNIEVTLKNWRKAFNPKYGRALTWVLPFWLSPLILPFVFMLSAFALLLAFTFNYPMFTSPFIYELITTAFLCVITAGVILNNGRGWLAGLFSPGIPVFTLIPLLLVTDLGLDGGVLKTIMLFGLPVVANLEFFLSIWVLVAIPATYLNVAVAEKHPDFALNMQVWVIGYWMFLLLTTFEGFRRELLKEKKAWVRTQR